jgi:hypothetical protein
MSTIIDINHETGDLTQYDSTATDGGDLSVASAAALAGTAYGLSCLIDDTTVLIARKNITKSVQLRLRVYLDPNSLTMANNDTFALVNLKQGAGSYSQIAYLSLRYLTATGYRLVMYAKNDAGTIIGPDTCDITDAPHYVEIYLVRAADSGSNNGTLQWWVDGSDQGATTGIDNYNLMSDQNWYLDFGAPASDLDAGTSGTFYLDEIVVNDDGGLIGPVSAGQSMGSRVLYYARMRH